MRLLPELRKAHPTIFPLHKVILSAGEKMSAIVNYKDCNMCPLFGNAAAAAM